MIEQTIQRWHKMLAPILTTVRRGSLLTASEERTRHVGAEHPGIDTGALPEESAEPQRG